MAKLWHPYEQNFINHPKFLVLSPGAICLWIEGKNYCDMHLTDGMIPRDALRTFRFNHRARVLELLTVIEGYRGPLWEPHDMGFKMHDYLLHNPCREAVLAKVHRADADRKRQKDKQKAWRERQRNQNVTGNDRGNGDGNVTVTLPGEQKQIQKQIQIHPSKEQKDLRAAPSPVVMFKGQRLVVFEWQVDELATILGDKVDAFDLHEWFFTLDKLATDRGLVIPKRDGGKWLQAQFVAEAQRRGIALRMATDAPETTIDPKARSRADAEAVRALLDAKRPA